jgi:hypothetical protein
MADSIQFWHKKWFYIKYEKVADQKFGFAPFNLKLEVTKMKSWDQSLTEAELEETELLMKQILVLQTTKG